MQAQTYTNQRGYRYTVSRTLREAVSTDALKRGIKQYKDRARYARNVEAPRAFPPLDWIKHQLLIHAQGPLLTINEDGEFSAKELTRAYVQQFCAANHLKEC
jgi:hypothetical protein